MSLRQRLGRSWIMFTALACVTGSASVALGQGELPDEDTRALRPELTGEDKIHVEELEKRIDELRKEGRYDEAIGLAEEILAIRRERQTGWTNADGEPADWYEVGDAQRVVEDLRLRKTLSLEQRAELEDADAKGSEIASLYSQGKFDQALELVREQLKVQRRLLGDEHPDVANSMNNLAELLRAKGDYAAAEPLCREALALFRKLLGDEHPDVASSLHNLAMLLEAKGDYAAAELLHREALALRRKLRGDEHPDVPMSLHNLAMLLEAKGDYAAAEPMYREALALNRKLLGDEHVPVAATLHSLAWLLHGKGDYAAAEPLCREALALFRKLLGDEHPHVAASLNNLALLMKDKGDYAAAEPLLREALALSRKVYGDEHPDVATNLHNLAELLRAKGDCAAAEPLHREALALRRKLLGDEHPDVPMSLDNLAGLLYTEGDYAAAERLYHEALALCRKLRGDEHPHVATGLNNLALLLYTKGDYASAEPLHREALALFRKVYGDEHPHVAVSLNNLANLLRAEGDYAAAEALYREALALRREVLGKEHPHVATSLNNLALLTKDEGDYAAAEALLVEAAEVFERVRLRISTRGGLERAGALRSPLPSLAAVQARLGRHWDAWRGLEAHFARGLLDEIALRQSRPLTEQERDREDSLIGRLNKLDERISSLLGQPKSADRDELLTKLRRGRETLQSQLAQFAATILDKYGVAAGEVYELTRIQRSLPSDAALVAWLDLKGDSHAANPDGEHWACIVRRTAEPIWVKLPGSSKDATWTEGDDTLPRRVREALGRRSDAGSPESEELLNRLHAQRMAPVEEHLSDVRHLVVLPAGWMAGVPVEALTDKYTISYAPSGTMYAWLRERSDEAAKQRGDEGVGRLLALGDPVFRQSEQPSAPASEPPDHGVLLAMVQPSSNAARGGLRVGDVLLTYGDQKLSGPEDLGPAIQQAAAPETTRGEAGILVQVWRGGETFELSIAPGKMGVRPSQQPAAEAIRGKRQLDAALAGTRGTAFAPLPGSRREVEAIVRVAEADGGPVEAMILMGPDASEHRLDELATSGELKKFRFLHLATHGVMDDQVAMRSALALSQESAADDREAYERVLAGEEIYDGRLTAEQIVRTWKLDADLVTLSACETALGKQAGGEGFLGFSQALFVAGARNIVLSLWKVGDVSTSILMEEFYRNVLVREMPLVEALREAKLTLRNMTRVEVERRLKATGIADWSGSVRSRAGKAQVLKPTDRPFEDPYYWTPFILIGAG